MLKTYCLRPSEEARPYGTEVVDGIDAQSHRHIFSLRVGPGIHGANNSVVLSYLVPAAEPKGSESSPYSTGVLAKENGGL